jgi:hypothetical protein
MGRLFAEREGLARRPRFERLRAAEAITGLHGFEIDPGLAQISIGLIADRVGVDVSSKIIEVRDALSALPVPIYDLVIANPPTVE